MKYILIEGLTHPPKLNLFGDGTELSEFDLYWIVYEPVVKLSKEVKQELKSAGWIAERHSRTRKIMWTFDKVDWKKTNEANVSIV